jgi:hypothetical protein
MVALANNRRATGELIVNGLSSDGSVPAVTVNGDIARTGRTIFSSSKIATPENASATVSMGKACEIEIAPNTTVELAFDGDNANADLTAGTLTVLKSNQNVIVTVAGTTYSLVAGESASSLPGRAGKAGPPPMPVATGTLLLLVGGIAAAVAIAVVVLSGKSGSSNTVVSPTR